MISTSDWSQILEVTPPERPGYTHLHLAERWPHILVTDNPFRIVRISPYTYAARLTHDVPEVSPTVVISTRDRNVLAIESEVRGALWNGVRSFFIVQGDTMNYANSANVYEVLEHLIPLRETIANFEVGMPVGSRLEVLQRRADAGVDFFLSFAFMDTAHLGVFYDKFGESAPLKYKILACVLPPFSRSWVDRAAGDPNIPPVTKFLYDALPETSDRSSKRSALVYARTITDLAKERNFSGFCLMGLSLETATGLAHDVFKIET